MIAIHLKDGRTLTGDLPGEEIRFVGGEGGGFVVERKVAEDWQTIGTLSSDAFLFAFNDEHLTLGGSASAGDGE